MGYVSNAEHTVSEMAGSDFAQFSALSAKHGDGWGIASIDNSNQTHLIVEPSRAKDSEKFAEITKSLKSDGALLHLRWATLGLGINEGNTHPFSYKDISFIHNGGVMPPSSLDPFVASEFKSQMRGDTDSEKYFFNIVTQTEKLGLIDGVLTAVRNIKNNLTYSSINAMLLTPEKYVVVCEHNNEKIPEGEGSDYYELYYRKDEMGILVSSTGWNQTGWTLIPNHSVVVIDRKNFTIELISL